MRGVILRAYQTVLWERPKMILEPFTWARYSNKLKGLICQPQYVGIIKAADLNNTRLTTGDAGSVAAGNAIKFYLLVSEIDGTILDARFQVYGQSALIGAGSAACDLMIGKNYDAASRISSDLIDAHLQDRAGESAFPEETYAHLNLVICAIEKAVAGCEGIHFAASYEATPVEDGTGEVREYPGWLALSLADQKHILQQVMESEVQPYVQLDEGGVTVIEMKPNNEVVIAYSGSCTSCYSAIGSTLDGITRILRARVHPAITVTPDLSSLNL